MQTLTYELSWPSMPFGELPRQKIRVPAPCHARDFLFYVGMRWCLPPKDLRLSCNKHDAIIEDDQVVVRGCWDLEVEVLGGHPMTLPCDRREKKPLSTERDCIVCGKMDCDVVQCRACETWACFSCLGRTHLCPICKEKTVVMCPGHVVNTTLFVRASWLLSDQAMGTEGLPQHVAARVTCESSWRRCPGCDSQPASVTCADCKAVWCDHCTLSLHKGCMKCKTNNIVMKMPTPLPRRWYADDCPKRKRLLEKTVARKRRGDQFLKKQAS